MGGKSAREKKPPQCVTCHLSLITSPRERNSSTHWQVFSTIITLIGTISRAFSRSMRDLSAPPCHQIGLPPKHGRMNWKEYYNRLILTYHPDSWPPIKAFVELLPTLPSTLTSVLCYLYCGSWSGDVLRNSGKASPIGNPEIEFLHH